MCARKAVFKQEKLEAQTIYDLPTDRFYTKIINVKIGAYRY